TSRGRGVRASRARQRSARDDATHPARRDGDHPRAPYPVHGRVVRAREGEPVTGPRAARTARAPDAAVVHRHGVAARGGDRTRAQTAGYRAADRRAPARSERARARHRTDVGVAARAIATEGARALVALAHVLGARADEPS